MSRCDDHCRLCLESGSKLLSISDENLSDLIQNLLRLTLLPKHDLICVVCYKKMESFEEFMKVCRDSEQVLVEDDVKSEKEESAGTTPNGTKRRKQKRPRSPGTARNVKSKCTHIKSSPRTSPAHSPTLITEPPPTFQCNECEENFWTRIALDVHMRQHTLITNERCTHCLAEFKTVYDLKVHKKKHVNNIVGGMKAKFQEMINENVTD